MTTNPLRKPFIAVIFMLVLASCGSPSNTQSPPVNPPPATTVPLVNPPVSATSISSSGAVTSLQIAQGVGAQKGFWQVFFTAPTGSRDASTYHGGLDDVISGDIAQVQHTLDIAAYMFDSPSLTQALLQAKSRGVTIRMVADDHDGVDDTTSTFKQLMDAGIPVVTDNRSALMHDKFMILDSTYVITGSWNYTVNDTYRNNNNALVLHSQDAVEDYQNEFNNMFVNHEFGPAKPNNAPHPQFTQDGDPIAIYFSPEGDVLDKINQILQGAQHTIRFMTFSFTEDSIGETLVQKASTGVSVEGIFEKTGSETQYSELTRLFCAGLPARQDGNVFVLHHKVFIIDGTTVLSGSFNVSNNATTANDENLISITDPDLAAQFQAEFDRRWAEATTPTKLSCK